MLSPALESGVWNMSEINGTRGYDIHMAYLGRFMVVALLQADGGSCCYIMVSISRN